MDNEPDCLDTIKKDSIYQLSIYLTNIIDEPRNSTDSTILDHIKESLYWDFKIEPNTTYRLIPIKIHHRNFIYAYYFHKLHGRFLTDTTKTAFESYAITVLKEAPIFFKFDCIKKDTSDFINTAMTSLKTIEIDKTK